MVDLIQLIYVVLVSRESLVVDILYATFRAKGGLCVRQLRLVQTEELLSVVHMCGAEIVGS